MYTKLLEKIAMYDTIIIHRHKEPDLDALGSQLGLRALIVENYKNKNVYCVGDENQYSFIGTMDTISDSVYDNALAIITDVAGENRVSDQRFKLAKETIVIDHHQNDTDFADIFIHDDSRIATCQMLTEMAMNHNLTVSEDAATYLFAGLVTDSGRFMYPATDHLTFEAAAFLAKNGARIQSIYDDLYIEDLSFKKLKGYFINEFNTTSNNVAYMKNDRTLKDQFNVSSFTISRGMVNQMAGIKGIPIWANFTEYDSGDIICEIRSKELPVVQIAKKYGGGGHALACGCTLSSWEETDQVLNDLNKLLERND